MMRSDKSESKIDFLRSAKMAAVLVCSGLFLLPGQAFAQTAACNAQLNAGTAEDALFHINEPIGIVVELGAGLVVSPEAVGDPKEYLDIPQFTYDLDCTADGLPGCTDAGNSVEFVDESVTTNCLDETGSAIDFQTNRVGDTVVFTPSPGSFIRNFSEQTCTVEFDVVVMGLAGDNTEREVIEIAGFASTGDSAATCDNGLTAGAEATVAFNLSTIFTSFRVTKDFSDDNPLPVEVFLRCQTGLPLEQSFTITDPAVGGQWPGVNFVIGNYEPGTLDCRVFERPVPGGYSPDYAAGVDDGVAGDVFDDEDGCWYEDVVEGGFTCEITNNADPGEFTVTKHWAIQGAEGDEVIEEAQVQITCDDTILSLNGSPLQIQTNSIGVYLVGDGDSATIEVDTSAGTANCGASEQLTQSGVESDDSDCAMRPIPAGGSSSCDIYNVVYFEGIPTLSPRGLALMVLLMLGVGLFGYRRIIA